MFVGSASFAQLREGTEPCFSAALNVATNKIAKDAKTKNSILNKIGFLADSCFYNGRQQNIVCIDAKGVIQFEVEFDRSDIDNRAHTHTEMSYQFITGTQGLNVYYVIYLVKGKTANSCSYAKTTVYTEDLED